MPAVKTHTPELRAALIDEAGKLLRAHGPAAITVRRLARAAGTSTTAIYRLFGDKSGLLEQMYLEGFARLRRRVTAVPTTEDPFEDLRQVGRAYRRAALASPHLYELMFGRPVPGFAPSDDAREVALESFRPVVTAVQRCVEAGRFSSDTDAEVAAHHLWALAHGLVLLEIHRTLPLSRTELARRYEAGISQITAAYAPDG